MSTRFVTLAIWLAAVAGGLAWALLGRPMPAPPQAAMVGMAMLTVAGAVEPVLGTPASATTKAAAPPPDDSRFKLLGVIAPHHGGTSGLALISVDGKPARAVAVGGEVDSGTRVLAVVDRQVVLGTAAGAPTVTLELPASSEAGRGRQAEAAAPAPYSPGAQAALTLHQLKELPLAFESAPPGEIQPLTLS